MRNPRDAIAVELTTQPRLTPTLAQALLTMIRHSDQHADTEESATVNEACHSDVIAS